MTKSTNPLKRAEAFYRCVAPFFQAYALFHLIEFCAGNGNVGRIFQERDLAEKVTFVDTKIVRGLGQNIQHMQNTEIDCSGIDDYTLPQQDPIVIIGIHACGSLTDAILERAVGSKAPVAVIPCCYNSGMKKYSLSNPPDSRLLLYLRPEDYYDTVRLQFLTEQGYTTQFLTIDQKITPMNNVLIGIP
jgi:hypothetical protein